MQAVDRGKNRHVNESGGHVDARDMGVGATFLACVGAFCAVARRLFCDDADVQWLQVRSRYYCNLQVDEVSGNSNTRYPYSRAD